MPQECGGLGGERQWSLGLSCLTGAAELLLFPALGAQPHLPHPLFLLHFQEFQHRSQLPVMWTCWDGSGLGELRVLEPSQGFNPRADVPACLLRLTSPSSDSLHQNYSGWPVEQGTVGWHFPPQCTKAGTAARTPLLALHPCYRGWRELIARTESSQTLQHSCLQGRNTTQTNAASALLPSKHRGGYYQCTSVLFLVRITQCRPALSCSVTGKWSWMLKCITQLSLKENVLRKDEQNLFAVVLTSKCGFKSTLQDRVLQRFLHFALPQCWKCPNYRATAFSFLFFFFFSLRAILQFQLGFKSLRKRVFNQQYVQKLSITTATKLAKTCYPL